MLDLYCLPIELNPALHFDRSLLGKLLVYWNHKRRSRLMPSRADLDPCDLPLRAHMGMIVLTDVIGDPPRFRYRLVGSKITAAVGRDATGNWLDEIFSPKEFEKRVRGYRWVASHRIPLRVVSHLRLVTQQWIEVETLVLPLSREDNTVDMILSVSQFMGAVSRVPIGGETRFDDFIQAVRT